jgi:hypothetical protein
LASKAKKAFFIWKIRFKHFLNSHSIIRFLKNTQKQHFETLENTCFEYFAHLKKNYNTNCKCVNRPISASPIALKTFIIGIPDCVVVAFFTLMNYNIIGVVKFLNRLGIV